MIAVERKGTGRTKLILGLMALVGILAVSNALIYSALQSQITSLDSMNTSLQTQVNTIQSQFNSLNMTHQAYVAAYPYSDSEYNALKSQLDALERTYQEYVAEHPYSESEYEALKNERDALKAPRLSAVGVTAVDQRPIGGKPYLHIIGEVWNFGNETAHNCVLKVVAYQDSTIVIDNYVYLGTIPGHTSFTVDTRFYYEGGALTDVDISPEWTA